VLALTLLVSLLLAVGVGIMAVAGLPLAQAEGPDSLDSTQLDQTMTDEQGQLDQTVIGGQDQLDQTETGDDQTWLEQTGLAQQAQLDQAAVIAPLREDGTWQGVMVVAQAGLPRQLPGGDPQDTPPGPPVAGTVQDPVSQFMQDAGLPPDRRGEAAAAVEQKDHTIGSFQRLVDQAKEDTERTELAPSRATMIAGAIRPGRTIGRVEVGAEATPQRPEQLVDAARLGRGAVSDLQAAAGSLSAALTLGFQAESAGKLTPEAALAATAGTSFMSMAALQFSRFRLGEGGRLASLGAREFANAAKLTAQATHAGADTPGGADQGRGTREDPGYSLTVGHATQMTLDATEKLAMAARFAADATGGDLYAGESAAEARRAYVQLLDALQRPKNR